MSDAISIDLHNVVQKDKDQIILFQPSLSPKQLCNLRQSQKISTESPV